MTLVKICGIRTLAEGRAALEAGADMLGFIFWERSKRYIAPADAALLIAGLRDDYDDFVAVGVFVDPTPEEAAEVHRLCRLDYVQLSGHEEPALVAAMPAPVLKALHVAAGQEDEVAEQVRSNFYGAHTYLLDTQVDGMYGGTGASVNWFALAEVGQACIVAGGLRPDNVESALRALRPRGVDVSGGVEFSQGGGKDPLLVRQFLESVRSYDHQPATPA